MAGLRWALVSPIPLKLWGFAVSHRFVYLLMINLAVSACAYTPEKAEIAPHVDSNQSNIGMGKAVAVFVTDGRDTSDIGHRGAGAIASGATISNDQNIPDVFRQAIFDGLKSKGFTPTDPSNSAARQLHVEIRSIGYSTSTGFWTGGVETKAALSCRASVQNNSYEHVYRFNNEERVMFVPTASHNNDLINHAVDSVLKEMFDDQALMNLLASH